MYRDEGADALMPVGETEFVQSIADQCESRQQISTSIAAGIVSHANLALGDNVVPVLEAHIAASGNRFRGIRHISAWHVNYEIGASRNKPAQGLLTVSYTHLTLPTSDLE